MPRYNLPRQSFRHRFFARNLASRERAGFQGFATRSQGLEREKVNHDLTRSPVVARSPRPYLPPCFPPFPFHVLATILVHFLWIAPSPSFASTRRLAGAIEKISQKRLLRTEERIAKGSLSRQDDRLRRGFSFPSF